MAVLLLFLSWVIQDKTLSMEELIHRLADDFPEVRDRARGIIQNRWESWTDADLAKLRKEMDSKNANLAVNAKAAVAHIETRRKFKEIPEEIWKAYPDIASMLDKGPPDKIGQMFLDMEAKIEKGELSARAVLPAALEFIADDRDTEIKSGFFSGGREHTYLVDRLAHGLIWSHAPAMAEFETADEARAWWRKNKAKTDKEWHLDGLTHKDQMVRAVSMNRLVALNDPTLYPRLLETFKSIDSEDGLGAVRNSLAKLPPAMILPELRSRMRDKRIDMRLAVMSAIQTIPGVLAEEILVEAMEDSSQRFGAMYIHIAHPRVCDWAGICLAERIKLDLKEFDWPESLRARDRKLEEIKNEWRKSRGLPPIPYLGPGVVAVAPEKVVALIPELVDDSAEKRTGGQRRLSQLGPGAWRPLQDCIGAASPPSKARLEEAARNWSNAVRSITADNEAATAYVKLLEPGLHLPFDFEAFLQKILGAWVEDENLIGLQADVTRGSDGRGISVALEVVKAKKPGVQQKTIRMDGPGSGCVLNWKREWFDNEVRKYFAKFLSAMSDPECADAVNLYLRKAGPEGKRLAGFDPEE